MTTPAQELAAKHYQVLATLTHEQRVALGREKLAENAARLNGKDTRTILEGIFEREARGL